MGSEGKPRAPALAAVFLISLIVGCEKPAPPSAPPPPLVVVCQPLEQEVIDWDAYTGTLESPDYVNVQPQISGMMETAPFKEGSIVNAGTVLFTIDVRPFQADLDAKLASQQQAEAQAALTQLNFNRAKELRPSNAISQQDYDTAEQNLRQAQAVVAAAKAAVETARINVEYCTVTAKVAGRVANKIVTPGNLVSPSVILTTIASIDPIYCYVNVDERSILKYQRLREEKKRVSARDAQIPCFMQLLNETNFPHEGVVDFVDNHVDPQTGTLRARGVYPNPGGGLIPGFFATVRVPGSGRYRTLLVPDTAIGTDQNNKYVLTVGPDKKVSRHNVTLGPLFDSLQEIDSGLEPKELVIYKGVQLARPGMEVETKEAPIDPSAYHLTAPGSPTTRDLPATRNLPPGNSTTLPATEPAPAEGPL